MAEGVQASWVALAAAYSWRCSAQVVAGPLAGALAGDAATAHAAAGWLRIAALGAPGLLLAAAGNGWMRGVQDTRRPLLFVLGANVLSAVLCPLLVYPAGLGPDRLGGRQRGRPDRLRRIVPDRAGAGDPGAARPTAG